MPTKTAKLPSQSKLREDFTYNAGTGDFTRYDGKWGHITDRGYVRIKYEEYHYMVHRLIWKWWYGYDPEEIDHINGDTLDNRIDNLRNVDRLINCKNQKKAINNTSGFTGVHFNKKSSRWVSRITCDNHRIVVGTFDTPQEAKEAREQFIKEFLPFMFSERHGT